MSYFSEKCPEMDFYLQHHTSTEPKLLTELRQETELNVAKPHMCSGKQQGRLLSIISKIISPKRILDIGTFTGYSALCLAEGLQKEGKLTTLDVDIEIAEIPKKYFAKSSYSAQIEFILQDAVAYLEQSTEIFDLVFVDANKASYVHYFQLLKNRLQAGSVVLFDNVLWYGKVLEEAKDSATRRIQELNKIISLDDDFENLILPLRDGIHLVRKK